jgi:hypothetical protein
MILPVAGAFTDALIVSPFYQPGSRFTVEAIENTASQNQSRSKHHHRLLG